MPYYKKYLIIYSLFFFILFFSWGLGVGGEELFSTPYGIFLPEIDMCFYISEISVCMHLGLILPTFGGRCVCVWGGGGGSGDG